MPTSRLRFAAATVAVALAGVGAILTATPAPALPETQDICRANAMDLSGAGLLDSCPEATGP